MTNDDLDHHAGRRPPAVPSSILDVAASLAPLTAERARRRQRGRQRLTAVGALAVVAVLIVAIGVSTRSREQVLTAAGDTVGGTVGGTAPGSTMVAGSTVPVPAPSDPAGTTVPITSAPTSEPEPSTTSTPSTSTAPIPATTSTTSDLATSTSTTTTTTPASLVTHLDGSYTETGEMLFGTPMCPDQEHRKDGTWTFADGTTLRSHTDFCAVIDRENVWTGIGSYTFTGTDGSTLTADFVNVAQLPTYGVPYTITIAAGTGRYAGVSGSCVVTVHLVDSPFGKVGDPNAVNTFGCEVAGWPATTAAP